MSSEPGYYSREALRRRLGDEAFEDAERQAREAPEPSLEMVELVRRVFGSVPDRAPVSALTP